VVPTAREPAALARHLDRAAAILRDRAAAPQDVRRAGEFQQLAVRALAEAPDRVRRKVLAGLQPETALVVRGAVRATGLLAAMTSPQETLPRWRILPPPPPARLLGHYRAAARRTGVPWTYLAAIHLVETRMGRIRGASTAGALGPMQFLPSTWELYGAGGDIDDPRDAIHAAARLLRHHGAPGDMAGALWHYNPSTSYVRAVTGYARTMQHARSAYRGYWHWRVLYRHRRGTFVLPDGYPGARPVLLRASTRR
jgi:soluble lytic murein transglycosylase-like protein